MSLYSELDPRRDGERGEWARIKYAGDVAHWRSWRQKAAIIGPVATFFEGDRPERAQQVFVDEEPILIIPDRMRPTQHLYDGKLIAGLHIKHPLAFDREQGAFGEILDFSEGKRRVTDIWVDYNQAHFVRAINGVVPFIDLRDIKLQVPAWTLAPST